MNFTIDDCYLTEITIVKEWGMYDNSKNLTDDQLMDILKGRDRCKSIHSEDHPEFTILREQLEKEGYIHIQRYWVNGDKVLKSFTLNGVEFKEGDQFSCAPAMKFTLQYKKKS